MNISVRIPLYRHFAYMRVFTWVSGVLRNTADLTPVIIGVSTCTSYPLGVPLKSPAGDKDDSGGSSEGGEGFC